MKNEHRTNVSTSLSLLLAAVVAFLVVGCGDSENFVFTTNNNPVATTGNLTFNFIQAQGVITVPIGTTTLDFTFYDGPNQTGNITLTDIQPFANQVTVLGVPTITQSYLIVARNANGAALTSTTGSVVVVPGQTVEVDVTGAITVLTQPNNTPLNVFVSNNGTGNAGDLDLFDQLFSFVRTFVSGNNQGIVLDQVGVGFHSGDTTVNVISRLQERTGVLDTELDRTLNIPGATSLKGSGFSPNIGILFLADFGGNQIITVASASDATTVGTMAATAPWDVVTDESADRMFVALTGGSVAVLDNASTGFGGAFTRTFTATGLDNAHGIAYHAVTDTIIVSDVGDPAVGDDGEIYVFANASTADGTVSPQAVIGGSNTLLGNPVDIDLANGDLRVAEKSQDQLLIFANILQSTGGNIAPAVAVAETKPEALVSQVPVVLGPDNSDIDGGVAVQGLVVSTNNGASNSLVRMTTNLDGLVTFVTGINNSESNRVDARGDVYLTTDSNLTVLGRAGTDIRDAIAVGFFDRAGGAVSSPKGLDVVEARGLVMVANIGDNSLRIFGKESDFSNLVGTTDLTLATAGGITWDLDYDPGNDRLFVTKGGSVLVYDNYLAGNPATATPDREINVTGAVFLHGIVYDAANDLLLLSDVANGGVANDGQLFVVEGASTADGATAPDITITNSGANMLGNPVDVAYDGTNLYVAEKSNNLVMRFDNIRASAGGTVAPSGSVSVTAPESISLVTGL